MNTPADLHIKTCLFEDESKAIRCIREAVFQIEQGIDSALEWDGLDGAAVHLVATVQGESAGVARLREIPGSSVLKLERLAVLPAYRRQGIGGEMVHTAIAYSRTQGYTKIAIHAQMPTVGFYEQLGFTAVGEPFEEASIPHLKMERSLSDPEEG
ncbi:GNAT family N-acetyltransferase [Altericista sp. CCNU0014]|uniref:GNAT family N-acetyltransferase n=1 Tax=Altericista sp. CCNU0014 TaxID=3082949 RepID=UPI00384BA1F7